MHTPNPVLILHMSAQVHLSKISKLAPFILFFFLFRSLRGRRRPRVRGDGVVAVVAVRRHLREGHLDADEGLCGGGGGGRPGMRPTDDPEGDVLGRRRSRLSRSVKYRAEK